MNFVADEGVDNIIVEKLRAQTHSVLYIKEEHPGISDNEVLSIAESKKYILITQDKDFGELVYRVKLLHSGVVLLRLSGMKSIDKAKLVVDVIEAHQSEIPQSFTVINKNHVKIRKH
jgi:predicted nuclease of predicted toxin-antitoxin system